jgi:hypothetical protein
MVGDVVAVGDVAADGDVSFWGRASYKSCDDKGECCEFVCALETVHKSRRAAHQGSRAAGQQGCVILIGRVGISDCPGRNQLAP